MGLAWKVEVFCCMFLAAFGGLLALSARRPGLRILAVIMGLAPVAELLNVRYLMTVGIDAPTLGGIMSLCAAAAGLYTVFALHRDDVHRRRIRVLTANLEAAPAAQPVPQEYANLSSGDFAA